jgi:hypothetical protein
VEFTSPDEVAVCNLASVALPMFVKEDRTFDFNGLNKVVQVMTRNLNKVIDVNHYPVKEAEYSNLRHRPIGIGVQGLADAFIKMRFPFDSPGAAKLNRDIFETIYFAALTASKVPALACLCRLDVLLRYLCVFSTGCVGSGPEARILHLVPRIAGQQRDPSIRHVECETGIGLVGLAWVAGRNQATRTPQFLACRPDAHGLHLANSRQQ